MATPRVCWRSSPEGDAYFVECEFAEVSSEMLVVFLDVIHAVAGLSGPYSSRRRPG